MKKNLFYCLAIVLSLVLVSCEKPEGSGTKPGNGGNTSHSGGVLNGDFSISQTKKIRFSQGNLQYQATTKTWRFAENQYDYIGNYNAKIAETYDGWIDMFGWATSGYNDKMPTMNDDYDFNYIDEFVNIAGTNSDWGVYNAISNGGNKAGLWRTLTIEEWQYILEERPNAEDKKGVASINGNNGVIILPDNWEQPEGTKFTSGYAALEGKSQYKTVNDLTLEQWKLFEEAGAVFLPAAGYRWNPKDIMYVNQYGSYWSSSYANYDEKWEDFINAWYVYFHSKEINCHNYRNIANGYSVRLVQDK